MKDYDELLKYYELYETIGTGNFYFFLRAKDDSSAIWEYSVLGTMSFKFNMYSYKILQPTLLGKRGVRERRVVGEALWVTLFVIKVIGEIWAKVWSDLCF